MQVNGKFYTPCVTFHSERSNFSTRTSRLTRLFATTCSLSLFSNSQKLHAAHANKELSVILTDVCGSVMTELRLCVGLAQAARDIDGDPTPYTPQLQSNHRDVSSFCLAMFVRAHIFLEWPQNCRGPFGILLAGEKTPRLIPCCGA